MASLWSRSLVLKSSQRAIRSYATVGDATRRKQVTIANDDGRVSWEDLSTREKAARTTQQTFNFGLIILGVTMTGGIGYLLYEAVFSSESKTSHFNRAVDEVRRSARARELLGPANKIRAFGEPTWNKWNRNRPIASSNRKDGNGRDHFLMHFNVEGPRGSGVVNVHMVRQTPSSSFEYQTLSLEVPGNATVYLRNTEAPKQAREGFKFLGVRWK